MIPLETRASLLVPLSLSRRCFFSFPSPRFLSTFSKRETGVFFFSSKTVSSVGLCIRAFVYSALFFLEKLLLLFLHEHSVTPPQPHLGALFSRSRFVPHGRGLVELRRLRPNE
jgi:hypothetical protein